MPSQRKRATENQEDYLERIHDLIDAKGYARVADIAKELKLTRPSVTTMVQQLGGNGYLNYEKYRGFTLTPRGLQVAQAIRRRHCLLTEFFLLIGVDKKTTEKDVEGVEHHISAASLKKLEKLVACLKTKSFVSLYGIGLSGQEASMG
ncbi:MAG: transcriptional regulator MntR [bacterium]